MDAATAAEIQRALDAALYDPIPEPIVIVYESPFGWWLWDRAVEELDK